MTVGAGGGGFRFWLVGVVGGVRARLAIGVAVGLVTAALSVPTAAVADDGGWTGSVSLRASAGSVDVNSPTAVITPTLSQPLAPGDVLSIYDDGWRDAECRSDSNCTVSITPGTNATEDVTAYVALDDPIQGPPVEDVRSVASLSISNGGWLGSVSLGTSTAGDGTVTVVPTLGRPLAGGYLLSIYDNGWRDAECRSDSNCTVTADPAAAGPQSFTAYVALDDPIQGPPVDDVRGFAGVTIDQGVQTASSIDGVDLDALATKLGGMSPDEIDAELVFFTAGTHLEESSVSDQQLAFDAALAAGKDVPTALKLAATAGGGIAGGVFLWFLSVHFAPPASPPAAPDPAVATLPLPPPDLTPLGPSASPTYLDELTVDLALRNPQLAPQQARTLAQLCIAQTQYAIANNAMPPQINGAYPCQSLPLYFPGSDNPDITQHDHDAIATNPAWAQLTYVSQTDRAASGLSRGWYAGRPECAGATTANGTDCDEYPFYSSAQSGPGASLKPLNLTQNRRAGNRYGNFAAACKLTSGGIGDQTSQIATGSSFLVIPMTFHDAPSTLWACRSNP